MNRVVIDDTSPVIIIDGSVLIISTYFGMIKSFEKGLLEVKPPEFYKLLHANEDFIIQFTNAITNNVNTICNLANNSKFRDTKYKFGNALIVKDCSRKDNWRTHLDITYKAHRVPHDKYDPKIIDPFWNRIFPYLRNSKGFKILFIDNIEADDLAYSIKSLDRYKTKKIIYNTIKSV